MGPERTTHWRNARSEQFAVASPLGSRVVVRLRDPIWNVGDTTKLLFAPIRAPFCQLENKKQDYNHCKNRRDSGHWIPPKTVRVYILTSQNAISGPRLETRVRVELCVVAACDANALLGSAPISLATD